MAQADLRGRLAADPEQVQAGTSTVTRLRLIADQTPAERTREEPAFGVDVEAWDEFGQALAQLHKGDPVIVLGNWKVAAWTDCEGNRRTKNYIRAFAGGPDLSRSNITGLTRRGSTTAQTDHAATAGNSASASSTAPASSTTPARTSAQTETPAPSRTQPADPFDED